MPKLTNADRKRLSQVARLANINPFTTERIELEREILGKEFVADDAIAWSRRLKHDSADRPNIPKITTIATDLVRRVRNSDGSLSPEETEDYRDVAAYVLLYRHVVVHSPAEIMRPQTAKRIWKSFRTDYEQLFDLPNLESSTPQTPGHLFAVMVQVRRAFRHIYDYILGDSLPTIALRRAVWESIFTNDLRRYRRSLYNRMALLPTLITGPSGTGKELVARAIGLSQHIPFDEDKEQFVGFEKDAFHALNLSAMSSTLIESELFGHRKGAFTGAIADRMGWLEKCQSHGAVFLDEIGELEPTLQVKLLRIVQQRTYARIGSTEELQFEGKILGATNRDLNEEMAEGRFREDLYYRLCADRIETPGLRQQLDDRPEDLQSLALYISRRLAGDDAEAVATEAIEWMNTNLGPNYPWRGNIRELEQCISSILIRGKYTPNSSKRQATDWLATIADGNLSAEEVLRLYCTWVYRRTGSYEATARQIGLDRRTVKSRIDQEWLARMQSPGS